MSRATWFYLSFAVAFVAGLWAISVAANILA
jgi:hypothetical protein